ncbi:hypothetical protein V8C34DRAFT_300535 [Trichoderma compactum]
MAYHECFQLIAPKFEKYTKLRGTPGQMLFNLMGKKVEHLVAIPIQRQPPPPKPDIVASPDPEPQLQNECPTVEATAGGSLQETQERNLKRKNDDADSSRPQQRARTRPIGANDALSKLPVELHRLIFDQIFFIEDADYPPGLFSEDELDELSTTIDIPYNYAFPDMTWESDVPVTLHHFTLPLFASKERFLNLSELSTDIYVGCRDRNKFRFDPALKSTYREIIAEEATYFPTDQPWILRNLTAKEFVRSEAIALKPEFIHGPFIEVFGFGQVIISRICWSTNPCTSINCAVPIHRGVWAGHAFDITTLAAHRRETTETEWRDVSEEVASEIAIICESKYGPDWREIMCGRFFDGRHAS